MIWVCEYSFIWCRIVDCCITIVFHKKVVDLITIWLLISGIVYAWWKHLLVIDRWTLRTVRINNYCRLLLIFCKFNLFLVKVTFQSCRFCFGQVSCCYQIFLVFYFLDNTFKFIVKLFACSESFSSMSNNDTSPLKMTNPFVGNKAKGLISKRVLQENKAGQIFWKTSSSANVW